MQSIRGNLSNCRLIISFVIYLVIFGLLYLLFFFGKNMYLGCLLVTLSVAWLVHQFKDLRVILLFFSSFFIAAITIIYFWDYRFSNYIALNIVSLPLLFVLLFLFRKSFFNLGKQFKVILGILAFFVLLACIFFNQAETREVVNRITNPEKYYSEIPYIIYGNKRYNNKVIVHIDEPQDESKVKGVFLIKGWAADLSEITDTKIDSIYAFIDGKPYKGGIFLEEVDSRTQRMDLAEVHGEKHKNSGFYFEVFSNKYPNGWHIIYVYAHSNYFGWNYNQVKLYFDN